MAATKELTREYLIATFKRGRAEYLPLDYIIKQAEIFILPEDMEKIEPMLSDMAAEGLIEIKGNTFKLLKK